MSVKYVLLTDKRLKNPCLSVNLSEILAHRPEQEKIRAVARIFIIIQLTVRLHTLHNQAQTSNKAHDKFVLRRDCACVRGHDRSASHLALIQHHLIYIQIMVETALCKQFFMASLLNDAAVL